jgi:hypothetical protein
LVDNTAPGSAAGGNALTAVCRDKEFLFNLITYRTGHQYRRVSKSFRSDYLSADGFDANVLRDVKLIVAGNLLLPGVAGYTGAHLLSQMTNGCRASSAPRENP